MLNRKLIRDIIPKGVSSAYVDSSFDRGKAILEMSGYRIISLQENSGLRIQEGRDAFVSKNGNFVREGFLYVPKKGKFLTKKFPVLPNAKEATKGNNKGEDFYLTNEQVDESLSDSVAISSISIPTERFADCDITVYAFGEKARAYGEFLRELGIKEMPIFTTNLQDRPFARQLWFSSLDHDCKSELNGYTALLGSYGVRGISDTTERK